MDRAGGTNSSSQSSSTDDEDKQVLEAHHIYAVMTDEYRLSRNIRAQWYFSHLNKQLHIQPRESLDECSGEIDVVSVIPDNRIRWNQNDPSAYNYLVTQNTKITFLSRRYRLVFCLDLSPSIATVDVQHGTILFDEVFTTLSKCFKGITRPCYIPGSKILFRPELCVTIIAHTPFYTNEGQQVLAQGWHITEKNVDEFLDHISARLEEVAASVADSIARTNEHRDKIKANLEKLTGVLFEDAESKQALASQIMTATPDISAVNMLRYGMLALQLLPENSSAGVVVITDGMLSLPNATIMESVLTQLRNGTISCSFLQLGSSYYPYSCLGFVPYSDLMHFISTATFGAYLPSCPALQEDPLLQMNVYHKAFYAWNFQRGLHGFQDEGLQDDSLRAMQSSSMKWTIGNPHFYCNQEKAVRKKHIEKDVKTSLTSLLSCRLREGYTIKCVNFRKNSNKIEVKLVLPWKFNVIFENTISSLWPPDDKRDQSQSDCCHYELTVEGTYEFLHDVMCQAKKSKNQLSPYRDAAVKQFWISMKNLNIADDMLTHLHSFTQNPSYYTIPESVKNGIPLFSLPIDSSTPVLTHSKNSAMAQFVDFWKRICFMDINVWQKWLHTHCLSIILKHDMPLPKNMHMPNSSGRYSQIQCRQAFMCINSFLSDYSSFVLIENNCYIKLLVREPNKPPVSFFVIRVASKPPCMVTYLAFIGGTPGHERNKILNELKKSICDLKFSKRGATKEAVSFIGNQYDKIQTTKSHKTLQREVNCCIVLRKPVEKLLIRYDKMPTDFLSPFMRQLATTIPNSKDQPVLLTQLSEQMPPSTLATLSRYLYHQRWVWTMQLDPSSPIPLPAVAEILMTLTKIRLQEGFHFAHSNHGIINMVLELEMKDVAFDEDDADPYSCIVQYVIFPPHANTTLRDSMSEEDETEMEMPESDGELQLITECWIEPQHGVTVNCSSENQYMEGLDYRQVAKSWYELSGEVVSSLCHLSEIQLLQLISYCFLSPELHEFHPIDLDCVSTLLTFEHLKLMCSNLKIHSPTHSWLPPSLTLVADSKAELSQQYLSIDGSASELRLSQTSLTNSKPEPSVVSVPFCFDLMSLLPKCQQAELLFSMFVEDLTLKKKTAENLNRLLEADGPNKLLFDLLMNNMKQINDREVSLSQKDQEMFLYHVQKRERDSKMYGVPFSWDLNPFKSDDDESSTSVPSWRCFCKKFSQTHIVLTILPASYTDLKKLLLSSVITRDIPLENLPAKALRLVKCQPSEMKDSDQKHSATSAQTNGGIYPEIPEDLSFLKMTSSIPNSPDCCDSVSAPLPSTVPSESNDLSSPSTSSTSSDYKCSLTLPIYVYDCPVSCVSSQLICKQGRQWKDVYRDFTFKVDDSSFGLGEMAAPRNDISNSHCTSPESRSEYVEDRSDRAILKRHCSLVEAAFSKSFVYSLFKSLQLGYHVDKQDVEAAVDGKCEEKLEEIDLTSFLRVICGHLKDFCMKMSLEEKHSSSRKPSILQDPAGENSEPLSSASEPSNSQRSLFPLDLLQRHHPCEIVQQLHSNIKQRFSLVLQHSFKPIPSYPTYYYFSLPDPEEHLEDSEDGDADESDDEDDGGGGGDVAVDDVIQEACEADMAENLHDTVFDGVLMNDDDDDVENVSFVEGNEGDILKASFSTNNTHSELSSLSNDEEGIDISEKMLDSIPPLFLHLTCSIRTKNSVGNCSLETLPTCLGEIINCLEQPSPGIDLDNLHLTLDVTCLHLPSDVDSLTVENMMQYTTSVCSTSSPLPECEQDKDISSFDKIPSLQSVLNLDEPVDHFRHLVGSQYRAVTKCIEKIKWMLQDEIAAAALDSYPLTSSTLEMVTNHVKNSGKAPCCITQDVPLQFVCNAELSLDKFQQAIKLLKVEGYRLREEGEYYYLVVDSKSTQRPFSSLIPPLCMSRTKDLMVQRTPHCDDNMELKKISNETEQASLSSSSQNIGPLLRRLSDTSLGDDSVQFMGLPKFPDNNGKVSDWQGSQLSIREQIRQGSICRDDETETDGEDNQQKFRSLRKLSSKSTRDRVARSASVSDDKNGTTAKTGCSAPAAVSVFPENWGEDSAGTERKGSQEDSFQASEMASPSTHREDNKDMDHSISHDMTTSSKLDSPSLVDSEASRTISGQDTSFGSSAYTRERADSMHSCRNEEVAFYSRISSTAAPLGRFHDAGESSSSTPVVFSEIDVSSCIGSGHVSNTEEGYEGNVSDSGESECDTADCPYTLETRHLPKFWIILKVYHDRVQVFFHMRHREDDDELRQSKLVFHQVVQFLKDFCKGVNQRLLLQNLHETRMCNQLLVPEANEDIWKPDENGTGYEAQYLHRELSPEEGDEYLNSSHGYLEANMKCMPGAFDCDVMWETHFTLHPRLICGPGRSGMSRGMQALRLVLTGFSVNNRKNMFVYQESSESVFYLRLHEINCGANHKGFGKADDVNILTGSRSPSVLSLVPSRKAIDDEENNEFRPRLNSGQSDKETYQDTVSINSFSSTTRKSQQCIALRVHGIDEPGPEIKTELVEVLQNRLDDAVLEVIAMMLARNPMCKLSPEDVQFIQKPGKEPTMVLNFTIPVHALPYVYAVHIYLRHNLLHFLNNPKYTDARPENHFKIYNEDPSVIPSVSDDDVFLFYLHQTYGTSRNNSIACIVLSIVDGQGKPAHISCLSPSSVDRYEAVLPQDYKELTKTSQYFVNPNKKNPGPIALIRFQIWCVGKVDQDLLTSKLQNAVQHALWDLVTEYYLLTAPLSESAQEEETVTMSEPTTPVKVRRTGKIMTEQTQHTKDRPFLLNFFPSKREFSSSVPDIVNKSKSPVMSPKENATFFKFPSGQDNQQQQLSSAKSQAATTGNARPCDLESASTSQHLTHYFSDKGKLNSVFHTALKQWFAYGEEIGASTIFKVQHKLSSRWSIPIVLKEIQTIIKNLSSDVTTKTFVESTDSGKERSYLPFDTKWNPHFNPEKKKTKSSNNNQNEELLPGDKRNFVVVARNFNQWRAYTGHSEYLENYLQNTRNDKAYQRFLPHVCNEKSSDMIASPISVSRISLMSAPLSAPVVSGTDNLSPSSSPGTGFDSPVAFVPRQKLLLVYVVDKEVTLYLYNWATEISSAMCKHFASLIQWHNARMLLLHGMISQKLGLFHNQPLGRISQAPKVEKQNTPPSKTQVQGNGTPSLGSNQFELLAKLHSPPQSSPQPTMVPGKRPSTTLRSANWNYFEGFRDAHSSCPLAHASYGHDRDPVWRFSQQMLDIKNNDRRDMQELQKVWESRGTRLNVPYLDRILHQVKQVARLSHYCLTPLLFSPLWRWKVAPVRDHTLETPPLLPGVDKPPQPEQPAAAASSRSRHSSGSSAKGIDVSSGPSSRMRRASGSVLSSTSSSTQSSPKPLRSPSDEAWHFTVCTSYLQEYIQYLQSLGFVAIQTKTAPQKMRSRKDEGLHGLSSRSSSTGSTQSVPYQKTSAKGPPAYYLIKNLLGGLLVFEIGLLEPYAYAYVYSLECVRLHAGISRARNSQFTAAFLDELDKIKVMMHLHSFTYDYHLRTIHSYISGRQLIFRQGYHLVSVLDDFIKYYQKAPNFARNHVYTGTVIVNNTCVPADQLYNYIISHNQHYGMSVLRMVPVSFENNGTDMDTEFVLVEMHTTKISYDDIASSSKQTEHFDVGLLATHDTSHHHHHSEKNTLILKYFVILTSQRGIFPNVHPTKPGSFQVVRQPSSQPSSRSQSRKSSFIQEPLVEQGQIKEEWKELTQSSDSSSTTSTINSKQQVIGMCDEDITYCGYFSGHEEVMQNVLMKEARASYVQLEKIVDEAAVHCRRDHLWNCLLPRTRQDDNSKDFGSMMAYPEFTELLKLVTAQPFDLYDQRLAAFLNMHMTWYQGLVRVLSNKFVGSCSQFISPDGIISHVAVTSSKCADGFVLLSVNQQTNKVDLCVVQREPASSKDLNAVYAPHLHNLIEDFVNVCSFHLWTGLLG